MENLDLDITYFGIEAGEKLWEEALAGGKLNLGGAALTTLSALMLYSDLCRIQTQWAKLTTLSIGAPTKMAVFGHTEAASVLALTKPHPMHNSLLGWFNSCSLLPAAAGSSPAQVGVFDDAWFFSASQIYVNP